MNRSSDQLELLAVVTLLFGYTVAGILLAGSEQMMASWVAILGGILGALIEIAAILRRM